MVRLAENMVAHHARTACLIDVLAPKAGNVHPGPGGSFADVDWEAFALSAAAAGPWIARAGRIGVGRAVLGAVQATRSAVGTNTNLGMVLLMTPLAAAAEHPRHRGLGQASVRTVLKSLGDDDANCVYAAIRTANPGGLGKAARGDVHRKAAHVMPLREAMALAAERDAVARQYVTDFADVLQRLTPRLETLVASKAALDVAVMQLHLEQMAFAPDSLIARKLGPDAARRAQAKAQAVLEANPGSHPRRFRRLDAWLRDDDHRRNPGTSADLVAAAVFAALCQGLLPTPWRWESPLPEPRLA